MAGQWGTGRLLIERHELSMHQEIGRGGRGIVFRASYYGAAVAVKEIHAVTLSPTAEAEFLREIHVHR